MAGRCVLKSWSSQYVEINLLDDGLLDVEIQFEDYLDVEDLREWAQRLLKICDEISNYGEGETE